MSYKPVSIDREGDRSIFLYRDVNLEEFPIRLERFFHSQGYKLQSGEKGCGLYANGQDAFSVLLRPLSKRFVFEVKLAGSGNSCRFDLAPFVSGISGGVKAYPKIKKETLRLVEKIKRTEL